MPQELALLGGPRSAEPGAVKSWPIVTPDTYAALSEVLDSGVYHTLAGPQCEALSREFAEFCGVKHCVVTNSGTSTLHMCVAAAGLEPGDEILLPAYTYWATAAGCLHGLTIPVFVDIDPDTYTMDPAKIESRISDRTKAIMPVHINGMPADMDPINEVAARRGLVVLGDACQAAGAEYNGRKTGGLCDAEGFSLNRSKTVSGCEGGIYATNRDDFAEYARNMTSFRTLSIGDPPVERAALGWMYRPLEFVNAFALEQLRRAPETLTQRRELARFLTDQLQTIPGLAGPVEPPNRNPCYFTYVVTFVRDEVAEAAHLTDEQFMERALAALRAEGLPFGAYQTVPLPGMDIFQKKQGFGRGYPWACSDKEYVYDPDDYPATLHFLKTHCNLGGVYPPNDLQLMESFVGGMRKVMSQPGKWVDRQPEA
ncbi:MAG: hypothetical protein COZ06_10810 [Armatimonadetes bacterium CG_4_10_14_3_um_filter_66_18]|nr:DegT/DnrJ/EryC1/StrS family aminotransferase [Armatimonadota bacterium]OIP06760.1 MAG: hypothetical protein AUJ96_08530 [Armatimonadetes bacterium CG2_30_66_41]PIU94927.1 MAG: hypothetical protein COS65_05160 [Armatimonadetes bacterium CG06_land_8_20_14_3_00_66_21]PIX40256.1 MAG: hypothetical protein COZ57_26435 [Armatimonadetes bacterium CG_4_8_14_3_um_filter_66_20]PIY50174.1 MAG: hypothetical protein COZ06_10810 [Armatimonadetes bacterium CG_4_10_14_3_um_filter_66_18]PIZ30208.1 MAG: hypot